MQPQLFGSFFLVLEQTDMEKENVTQHFTNTKTENTRKNQVKCIGDAKPNIHSIEVSDEEKSKQLATYFLATAHIHLVVTFYLIIQ